MSRIGKQPITVPSGVTVSVDASGVKVKGPKGTLAAALSPLVDVKLEGSVVNIARREDSREIIELPMSRQDIADYLGLTIETISRTMTLLENEAAIELPNARRVVVRSRGRLQQLNA